MLGCMPLSSCLFMAINRRSGLEISASAYGFKAVQICMFLRDPPVQTLFCRNASFLRVFLPITHFISVTHMLYQSPIFTMSYLLDIMSD